MFKFSVFFVISLLLNKNLCIGEKLNVDILFESLCRDSINFVRDQLYPSWHAIAPYVNIKFVPFGKSSSLADSNFVCQHGPKECMGNRIMSCALSAIPDQNAQVEYVHCFMNAFKKGQLVSDHEFGQSCAAQVGLNWDHVTQCYDSHAGTNLQLQAEKETAVFKPKFVPTILYNGQFHQQAQDDSLENFRGVVCSLVQKVVPEACAGGPVIHI